MKHKLFSFSAILAAILSLTACGSGESAADVNYSEIAASFSIPDDLTVEDVVFGDDLIGEGTWEVDENQLELTVTGDKVDLQAAEGKALFATIKVSSVTSGNF